MDPTIRNSIWSIGELAIPIPTTTATPAAATIFTPTVLWRWIPDPVNLKWHYQFTPHDVWDYDGVNEMVLIDFALQTGKLKALVHADRNGHFYAIDRTNGTLRYAKPYVRVTWAKGIDDNGRPVVNPEAIPTIGGVTVCPGAAGGKEWNAMAYSPVTQLVYVPVIENCAKFVNNGVEARRQGSASRRERLQLPARASLRKGSRRSARRLATLPGR